MLLNIPNLYYTHKQEIVHFVKQQKKVLFLRAGPFLTLDYKKNRTAIKLEGGGVRH